MTNAVENSNNQKFGTEDSTVKSQLKESNGKTWFDWLDVILVPLIIAGATIGFSWVQFKVTNQRQDADNTNKVRETKEQVLTDYSKAIAELVTTNGLGKRDDTYVQNIARGQTLVALRRLNTTDTKSKTDAGKLKGLLIRYLYDTQLIGYDCSYVNNPNCDEGDDSEKLAIDLFGADMTNVVLQDAWLPHIALQKAWLNNGDFQDAYLMGAELYQSSLIKANFTGADLTGANFTNADLRFAVLHSSTLEDATLTGACYVEGTEDQYFPANFNPKEAGMKPVAKENSDPSNPAQFKRCEYVFLSPNP